MTGFRSAITRVMNDYVKKHDRAGVAMNTTCR
jgi:hypothetical protein